MRADFMSILLQEGPLFQFASQPEPERIMQHLHEVKVITQEGYAVRRITAPSVGHVVALLAEEDKADLDEQVTSIEIKRVTF